MDSPITWIRESCLRDAMDARVPFIVRFMEEAGKASEAVERSHRMISPHLLGTMTMTKIHQEQPDRDPTSTAFSVIVR